jgi:hypothetical protein
MPMSAGVTGIATGRRKVAGGLVHGRRKGELVARAIDVDICLKRGSGEIVPVRVDAGTDISETHLLPSSAGSQEETAPRHLHGEGGVRGSQVGGWHHLVVLPPTQLTSSHHAVQYAVQHLLSSIVLGKRSVHDLV